MDVLEALNNGLRVLVTKSTPLHLEGEVKALTTQAASGRFAGIRFDADSSLLVNRDEWPLLFLCSVTTKPWEDTPGNLHESQVFLSPHRGLRQEAYMLQHYTISKGSDLVERYVPRNVGTLNDVKFIRAAKGRVGDRLTEGTESLVVLPVVVAQTFNCTWV